MQVDYSSTALNIWVNQYFANFLKEKYNLEDINFIDHFKLTGKKLTMIGTNFSKACETVFNYETYPLMSVITAIRISCSIPVIFEPVLFEGDYYIDGGLINNFYFCKKNFMEIKH